MTVTPEKRATVGPVFRLALALTGASLLPGCLNSSLTPDSALPVIYVDPPMVMGGPPQMVVQGPTGLVAVPAGYAPAPIYQQPVGVAPPQEGVGPGPQAAAGYPPQAGVGYPVAPGGPYAQAGQQPQPAYRFVDRLQWPIEERITPTLPPPDSDAAFDRESREGAPTLPVLPLDRTDGLGRAAGSGRYPAGAMAGPVPPGQPGQAGQPDWNAARQGGYPGRPGAYPAPFYADAPNAGEAPNGGMAAPAYPGSGDSGGAGGYGRTPEIARELPMTPPGLPGLRGAEQRNGVALDQPGVQGPGGWSPRPPGQAPGGGDLSWRSPAASGLAEDDLSDRVFAMVPPAFPDGAASGYEPHQPALEGRARMTNPGLSGANPGGYGVDRPGYHPPGVSNSDLAAGFGQGPSMAQPGAPRLGAGAYGGGPYMQAPGQPRVGGGAYAQNPGLHSPGVPRMGAAAYGGGPAMQAPGIGRLGSGAFNGPSGLAPPGLSGAAVGAHLGPPEMAPPTAADPLLLSRQGGAGTMSNPGLPALRAGVAPQGGNLTHPGFPQVGAGLGRHQGGAGIVAPEMAPGVVAPLGGADGPVTELAPRPPDVAASVRLGGGAPRSAMTAPGFASFGVAGALPQALSPASAQSGPAAPESGDPGRRASSREGVRLTPGVDSYDSGVLQTGVGGVVAPRPPVVAQTELGAPDRPQPVRVPAPRVAIPPADAENLPPK